MEAETKVKISKISSKIAINFLINKHYSGRKPQIKYAFGLYENEEIKAVITYGIPASRSLCVGILGDEYYDKVIELNRLCRTEDCNTNMSYFLGFTLRELKKLNLLIVSYADTGMSHFGFIYQATNFIYTGITKERTDKYTPNNKHSRHYTEEFNHLRKVRTAKHRYVYFACDKRVKKQYLKNLKYKIQEYPKGEMKYYKLGDFQKQTIINKLTGESYLE